jgi:hypothetical protein
MLGVATDHRGTFDGKTSPACFRSNSDFRKPASSLLRVLTARAAQGFALTGAFEAIPVVTGGELIISRLVFTRFVLISAHTKKIDANKHMTANKPV